MRIGTERGISSICLYIHPVDDSRCDESRRRRFTLSRRNNWNMCQMFSVKSVHKLARSAVSTYIDTPNVSAFALRNLKCAPSFEIVYYRAHFSVVLLLCGGCVITRKKSKYHTFRTRAYRKQRTTQTAKTQHERNSAVPVKFGRILRTEQQQEGTAAVNKSSQVNPFKPAQRKRTTE